jgi:hypothetical protein
MEVKFVKQYFFILGKRLLLAATIGALSVAGCGKKEGVPAAHCSSLISGCTVPVGDKSALVRFSHPPAVLKPFGVEVMSRGARRIEVSFTMAGMEMGSNIYRLEADSQGVWRSQVVLPACVTGRSDWVMTLAVDGAQVKVPFSATK